jgi:hypothetical protein
MGLMGVISSRVPAHEPQLIASGRGASSPKQPQIAVGVNGDVHVVFGIGDGVQYCRSSAGIDQFDAPRQVFKVPNMSLGMRRGPRIAATSDSIVITAIGGAIGKGRDGDVLSWRSPDRGATWQGPVRVNDSADSAREGLHAMASGPDGSVWCVWLDLRDRRSEIYGSRSMDGGATWEPNIRVYQSPDGSVCECCHPSVIVAKNGLHVMFRNSLAGNRDMYVVSSLDHGKSFTPAKKLGNGTWPLDACPMDGGMLAVNGTGVIETVWRRDGNIYTAPGTGESEVLLGRGQQPWIATATKGSFIVWTSGREGDLMLRASGSKSAYVLAQNARDPIVVAAPGETGEVYCGWEAKSGDNLELFVQRVDGPHGISQ